MKTLHNFYSVKPSSVLRIICRSGRVMPLFLIALHLQSCNPFQREEACGKYSSQAGSLDDALSITLDHPEDWLVVSHDSTSLSLRRDGCESDEPDMVLHLEKLPAEYDKAGLVHFRAGDSISNIHFYRLRRDSLPFPAFARSLSDTIALCSSRYGCNLERYQETIIFLPEHLIRMRFAPDRQPNFPHLIKMLRGLTFAQTPLGNASSLPFLKFHRDIISLADEAAIPDSVRNQYSLSREDRERITSRVPGFKSITQCDEQGWYFLEKEFCRRRYQILHPLD